MLTLVQKMSANCDDRIASFDTAGEARRLRAELHNANRAQADGRIRFVDKPDSRPMTFVVYGADRNFELGRRGVIGKSERNRCAQRGLRARALNCSSMSCSNLCSKAFSRSSNVVISAAPMGPIPQACRGGL